MNKIIGIGEYTVADYMDAETIKTYALASCVAVVAYSHTKKAAGMIHIALPIPLGKDFTNKQGFYATTGIPLMINRLCSKYGCEKKELTVNIFGGADSINQKDIFKIGRRNIDAVKKTLLGMNMEIYIEEIGGTISRTIELDISSGKIKLSTQPITI